MQTDRVEDECDASLPINKNKTQVSAPFRKHIRNPYYVYTLKMSRLFYIAQTELVRKSYQSIDSKKNALRRNDLNFIMARFKFEATFHHQPRDLIDLL